jgi:nicotinamide riboside kinase
MEHPKQTPLKIAVLGGECTGKSTLIASMQASLSSQFNTRVLNEALRDFCILKNRTPLAHEQAFIINQQMQQEQAVLAPDQKQTQHRQDFNFILCDSAPIATAIYSGMYFDDLSLIELATNWHATYALTLVLAPDFAWQPDAIAWMRDGPQARSKFDQLLHQWLIKHPISHVLISGDLSNRLASAMAATIALVR